MKVGFFIGCNTAFNRPDLENAVRHVFPLLGVELDHLEGQSCCPTWGTMPSIDLVGWCALGARNYAIAEERGVDLITVCSTCHGSLSRTADKMHSSREVRRKVNRLLQEIGREYRGVSKVRHAVRYLHKEVGLDEIKKRLKHRLDGITVAIQPGCLSLWPQKSFADQEENAFHPRVLRELCEVLGASAPYYRQLLDCCGMGGMRSTDMEKSFRLVERKMTSIKKEVNPDLIVTSCSSCLIQFDTAQEFLQKKGIIYFEIPILHFMQVLALCLGAEPKMVTGLSRTPVDKIIKRIIQG
jgi:heterodisulfide reductase subunit B